MLVTLIWTTGVVTTFSLGVSNLTPTRKAFAYVWFTACGAMVVSGLYLYVM
ncbi:hypothetical protein ACSHWB_44585 [Lentzea sp. HUAS TT2]|uniref:hypothetical protein n=1 Tax=Lentzea sp. HUAS TT2 TaxID=3447454 RepID=UPI003F6E508E